MIVEKLYDDPNVLSHRDDARGTIVFIGLNKTVDIAKAIGGVLLLRKASKVVSDIQSLHLSYSSVALLEEGIAVRFIFGQRILTIPNSEKRGQCHS
jgi:hypothetical protein